MKLLTFFLSSSNFHEFFYAIYDRSDPEFIHKESFEPVQRLGIIFRSDYFVSRTCAGSTTKLFYPVHWLIDHTVQVVFVIVSLLVFFDRWGAISSPELMHLHLRRPLLGSPKVPHDLFLFHSLRTNPLHFLFSYRGSSDSFLGINDHKSLISDFFIIMGGHKFGIDWDIRKIMLKLR